MAGVRGGKWTLEEQMNNAEHTQHAFMMISSLKAFYDLKVSR